ncbi:MHS family alpha-ketoglutarate permease-like MFS transporter [Methylobacterium sp. 1030]
MRSIFGGSVGKLIEWFDFYVYPAFAIYSSKNFFPGFDQTAQLPNTTGVFSLGFLMPPIGSLVLGSYADRRGRREALALSVLMMAGGSLIIALCLSYGTIGVGAPLLLIARRIVQGFSMSGEYGTSATYLSEIATADRRGYYSSFQYVTLIGGQLLATLLLLVMQTFLLTQAELEAWGWRMPFAIGAAGALFAMWLRRNLAQTEEFRSASASHANKAPVRELFRHPRAVLLVMGLTLGGTVAFYTFYTYMQKFLINTTGLTRDEATAVSTASLSLFWLLQPIMGSLSDRIGRKPLLIAFGTLGFVFTVPIFTTVSTARAPWLAFLICTSAPAIVSAYSSVNAVVKAELFPASVRAVDVGFPYALTVSLFGGSAEYIALRFKNFGHEDWLYYYVMGCIGCSLLTYIFMRDTRTSSEIGTEANGVASGTQVSGKPNNGAIAFRASHALGDRAIDGTI